MKIGTTDHRDEEPISQGSCSSPTDSDHSFLARRCLPDCRPAWMLMLAGGESSTALSVARDWHVHEMVFGFLPAVITGFLLTAVPNWTDRPPIQGRALIRCSPCGYPDVW